MSISRWLYNIKPLAAVTLLDTFHDLKREALQVFLARTARADKKDDTSTLRAAVVDGQIVLTSPDAAEEISASKLWAALNHQTRMDLKEVCARNTTPLMLILTLSLEPLQVLNKVIFDIDTEAWEHKQQVKLIGGGTRLYRLLEARKGNVTREFWAQSGALMENPKMWAALPAGSFTLENRAIAFATVAASQGSIWYYSDDIWQLYPFPLFDLVDETLDPIEVTRRTRGHCRHMYDEFTKDFRTWFWSEEAMSGPEARLLIVMVLLKPLLTMQRIECRHAGIRRMLNVKGSDVYWPNHAQWS